MANTTKGLLSAVLATIRQMESGNYTQPPNAGGASGAYQYINSTWATQARAAGYSQYAGSPSYLAPPSVQDAVAAFNVQQILKQYGSVNYVPLVWYYPAAIGNPSLLNQVPDPGAGNTETPAQYQQAWLNVFQGFYSGKVPTPQTPITRPGGGSTGGKGGGGNGGGSAVDAYLTSVTENAPRTITGDQYSTVGFSLGGLFNWIGGHIPIIGSIYTGASDIVTGVEDFLKFIAWIFNPITWLRAVEFLVGIGLMAFGIHISMTSFKEATGPSGLPAIFKMRTARPRAAARSKAGALRQRVRRRSPEPKAEPSDAERIGLEG